MNNLKLVREISGARKTGKTLHMEDLVEEEIEKVYKYGDSLIEKPKTIVIFSINLRMKKIDSYIDRYTKPFANIAIVNPLYDQVTIMDGRNVSRMPIMDYITLHIAEMDKIDLFVDGLHLKPTMNYVREILRMDKVEVLTYTTKLFAKAETIRLLFKGDNKLRNSIAHEYTTCNYNFGEPGYTKVSEFIPAGERNKKGKSK